MHQRYCTCGQSIWVNYVMMGRDWRAIFAGRRDAKRAVCLRNCPSCGASLNINKLR